MPKLHPDLAKYHHPDKLFGHIIQHPLIYSIPHHPQLNQHINNQYQQKLHYLNKFAKNKQWSHYLILYEKPYRFNALETIQNQLTDKEFWKLFGECWITSENLWQSTDYINQTLTNPRPHQKHIMTITEQKAYNKLPKNITIHRGHQHINQNGYSWTLNKTTAQWFANRLHQKGTIKTIQIPKTKTTALLLSRNEQEIIYNPNQ